jgi:hypothetical protein
MKMKKCTVLLGSIRPKAAMVHRAEGLPGPAGWSTTATWHGPRWDWHAVRAERANAMAWWHGWCRLVANKRLPELSQKVPCYSTSLWLHENLCGKRWGGGFHRSLGS